MPDRNQTAIHPYRPTISTGKGRVIQDLWHVQGRQSKADHSVDASVDCSSIIRTQETVASPNHFGTSIMNRPISLILLAAGVALVIFGLLAMDSFASDFSKFFTGSPTDKSIWMLIAGVVLISISGFGLFRESK